LSFVPWYDPNKKLSKQLEAAFGKAYPGLNLNTNQVFTFEALLVAADAYKRRARPTRRRSRRRSAPPTSPTMSASGPASNSMPRARTNKLKNAAIQNRGGKLVTVAPKFASNAKAEISDDSLR